MLLALPGLTAMNLQITTTETGGMDLNSDLMSNAQSAEDGALGIRHACADPHANPADVFGPKG